MKRVYFRDANGETGIVEVSTDDAEIAVKTVMVEESLNAKVAFALVQ